MDKNYDSFDFRIGSSNLNKVESELMKILIDFGISIDPHGYDDGNYEKPIKAILELLKQT